MTQKQITPVLE